MAVMPAARYVGNISLGRFAMFQRVVVGVDLREGGRDAIALATKLIAEDGECTLVHMASAHAHIFGAAGVPCEDDERERILKSLERARAQARIKASLSCTRSRSVAHGLRDLAEREGADARPRFLPPWSA